MIKAIKTLFLFLLSIHCVLSQETDSLVLFYEIEFTSEYEKEAFSSYLKNKNLSPNLLTAINDTTPKQNFQKIEKKYNELIKNIK